MKLLNVHHVWLLLGLAVMGMGSLVYYDNGQPVADLVRISPAAEPIPERRLLLGERLDVNRATPRELQALPGVGPKLAMSIVNDRERHGPFPSVESLRRVRGIGSRNLAKLCQYLVVSGGAER